MTDDEQRRWYLEGAGATGLGVAPLPFFDPRARPQPLGTVVQRIRLSGAWRGAGRAVRRRHRLARGVSVRRDHRAGAGRSGVHRARLGRPA
jgi:hypothetical protein